MSTQPTVMRSVIHAPCRKRSLYSRRMSTLNHPNQTIGSMRPPESARRRFLVEPLLVDLVVAAIGPDRGQAGGELVLQRLVALAHDDAEALVRKARVFDGLELRRLADAVGDHAVVADRRIDAAAGQLGDDQWRALEAADVRIRLAELARDDVVGR